MLNLKQLNMRFNYNDIEVTFDELVLNTFKNYIQFNDNDYEAGGILVGKKYSSLIEITNCSVPNKKDKRGKHNFKRAYKSAQKFINKQFKSSKGSKIYLGEWHTHPENTPCPSHTDIKSFEKTIRENRLNSNIHFMVIVGRIDVYIALYTNKVFAHKNILKIY